MSVFLRFSERNDLHILDHVILGTNDVICLVDDLIGILLNMIYYFITLAVAILTLYFDDIMLEICIIKDWFGLSSKLGKHKQ